MEPCLGGKRGSTPTPPPPLAVPSPSPTYSTPITTYTPTLPLKLPPSPWRLKYQVVTNHRHLHHSTFVLNHTCNYLTNGKHLCGICVHSNNFKQLQRPRHVALGGKSKRYRPAVFSFQCIVSLVLSLLYLFPYVLSSSLFCPLVRHAMSLQKEIKEYRLVISFVFLCIVTSLI